jgi:hypothetical protein
MGATALDVSVSGRTYRCTVNVTKTSGHVTYLGVGLQNILRANKFQSKSWLELGHGNYINRGDGYTYSHSDGAVNCKKGTLEFKEGDVVEMEFDTTSMLLLLRCNG